MPELPEVETIVRQLKEKVMGKVITSCEIADLGRVDAAISGVIPVKIMNVWRRAKLIVFDLENGQHLLVELRMTGYFKYRSGGKAFDDFLLAAFHLNDGSVLTHHSIRRFGSVKLVDGVGLQEKLSKFGPEPLEIDLRGFSSILGAKPKANLKTTLMDASVIAGIGNIYAQEALYYAGISPYRKAGALSDSEVKVLFENIKILLKKAIEHNGTTVESYSSLKGSGGFQKFLAVYGKYKCPKKHFLGKVKIGGRGTSYCKRCQR